MIPAEKFCPRIVCLSHDSIDMLIQLGAHRMVVGRPAGEHRAEVAHARSIGGYGRIRSDVVAALEPDLVIGYAAFQMRQCSALADMGLNVLTLAHHRLDDIVKNVALLAAITGTAPQAAVITDQFHNAVASFESKNQQRDRIRVYFEEWMRLLSPGPCGFRR
jgi:iron complex transport system substrate-binding protein